MLLTALAYDRASVRRRDVNGYLHVDVSNISKANVCPYFGREIPDWQALGLDATKVYYLYRDPVELERGARTFNNVPILSVHEAVSADDYPDDLVIGSTGTDAAFVAPYLQNSLVIWPSGAQQDIDSKRKYQLSSSYRYRADMTPGAVDGLRFDGVMRDIVGNHVALVFEGRAGPDVVVGDENMLKSRTALMVSGAVAAMVRPLLAQDAKVDIASALEGVDAKSLAADGAPKSIAGKVVELVTPHLAADAQIDPEAIEAGIAAVQPAALAEDTIPDPAPAKKPVKKPTATVAADGATDDGGSVIVEPGETAMDAATVQAMVDKARTDTRADVLAIAQAQRDVEPLVGEVLGMDSAAAIYTFALDSAGFKADDLKDTPTTALKAMVAREVERSAKPVVAHDAKPVESKLAAIVPNLPPLIRS